MNSTASENQIPRISVIVPVYKVEPYLAFCVDSILAQTFTDFELILVDDGSPDNCGKMCDEYAERDSRIKVIHRANGGQAAARNSGMDIAQGEYIAFIDSDDAVADVYLETLYNMIMESGADLAVCGYNKFEDGTSPEGAATLKEYSIMSTEAFLKGIYNGHYTVAPWAKLYRKSIVQDERFPEGKIHEDSAFVPIVCYNAKEIVISKDKLYLYRIRIESTSRGIFVSKRYDNMECIESCIAFFKSKGEIEIVEAAEKSLQIQIYEYYIRARKDGAEVPEKYRVGLLEAVNYLRKNLSDDYYEYYLGMIHPKLPMVFEYRRKIEQILGLRK